MKEPMKLKKGCNVIRSGILFEGYELGENLITANIGSDHIEEIMRRFIDAHEKEPMFFILEIPTNINDEEAPNISCHKDVYYIDGCSRVKALAIMEEAGELLFEDGFCAFGYGCHESGDEIMFGKYNVMTIYSVNTEAYESMLINQGIPRTKKLVTAWDTFTPDSPGLSESVVINGKSVYDIPKQFESQGMYFAERREGT